MLTNGALGVDDGLAHQVLELLPRIDGRGGCVSDTAQSCGAGKPTVLRIGDPIGSSTAVDVGEGVPCAIV